MSILTQDQIAAFAPGSRSMTAARKLAKPEKWRRLGRDGDAVWGVAVGSKGDTYAVYVQSAETAGQALRCTCPSRKRPCKHTLGLALLANTDHDFGDAELFEGHRYS